MLACLHSSKPLLVIITPAAIENEYVGRPTSKVSPSSCGSWSICLSNSMPMFYFILFFIEEID